MKNILKILVLFAFVGGALVSCETYGDPEKEIYNVAPFDGRWICYAFDYDDYMARPTSAIRLELVEIYASGTSEKEPGKLWMHIGYMLRNNATSIETISVKVDCNTQTGTFGITGGKTAKAPSYFSTPYYATTMSEDFLHVYSGYPQRRGTISTADMDITISGGTVTVDGYHTPTKHRADLIVFTLDMGSYKYVIEGHRHTGWADDYNSTYDTSTAHHKWNVAAYIEEWMWRRDGVWPIPDPEYFEPANTFQNESYAILP